MLLKRFFDKLTSWQFKEERRAKHSMFTNSTSKVKSESVLQSLTEGCGRGKVVNKARLCSIGGEFNDLYLLSLNKKASLSEFWGSSAPPVKECRKKL